jgi:hypothetical protein
MYFRVRKKKVVADPDTFVPSLHTFPVSLRFNLRNNKSVPIWQSLIRIE